MVSFFLAGKLSIDECLDGEDLDCTIMMLVVRTLQNRLRATNYRVDEFISERPEETQRPWRYLSENSAFINRRVFSGADYDRLFVDDSPPCVSRLHQRLDFASVADPKEVFSIDAGTTTYVTCGDYASRLRCASKLNAALAPFEAGDHFKASDPTRDEFRDVLRCVAAWTLEENRCSEELVVVALGTTVAHCGVFKSIDHLVEDISTSLSSVSTEFAPKNPERGDLAVRTGFSLRKLFEGTFIGL